jgi:toxin ParE1/3/4
MTIVWTYQARLDRRTIFHHISRDNPAAAIALDERFALAAGRLQHLPLSGRPGRVAATRELLIHPSYLMIYDIVERRVRVLAIIHTARQWPPEA